MSTSGKWEGCEGRSEGVPQERPASGVDSNEADGDALKDKAGGVVASGGGDGDSGGGDGDTRGGDGDSDDGDGEWVAEVDAWDLADDVEDAEGSPTHSLKIEPSINVSVSAAVGVSPDTPQMMAGATAESPPTLEPIQGSKEVSDVCGEDDAGAPPTPCEEVAAGVVGGSGRRVSARVGVRRTKQMTTKRGLRAKGRQSIISNVYVKRLSSRAGVLYMTTESKVDIFKLAKKKINALIANSTIIMDSRDVKTMTSSDCKYAISVDRTVNGIYE